MCTLNLYIYRSVDLIYFFFYIHLLQVQLNTNTGSMIRQPTISTWLHAVLAMQCNRCLSPLMLWVRISIRVRCTTLYDKVCQWLATGQWFSPGPLVSSTNKTDHHYLTEMLLKVAFNTIKQTNKQQSYHFYNCISIYDHPGCVKDNN